MDLENKNIDIVEVKKLYDSMVDIWPKNDKWYAYTYKRIQKFLKKWEKRLKWNNSIQVLNAGSGGNTYDIAGHHLHLDITSTHILENQEFIISSIESIPLDDNLFDLCICVGSVINYCNAMQGISELSRTLKQGGYLILEFDQSKNYEFLGTATYNSNLDIVNTFNSGFEDKIWVYSEKYIKSLLTHYDLRVVNIQYFHSLSSLIYKFLSDEQKAAKFVHFDKIVNLIPGIRKISNNIILIAQKI